MPLISRLSVLTVTRKRSSASSPIGCSAIEARGAGLHVGVRAQLERDPLVADVRREPAEVDRAVAVDGDVVDDADAVAEPVGAAPLDRLPDRGQPERLAGVDREVGVLALEVLERVEVPGGRVAGLGAGDVEPDHAVVAVGDGELGDLPRARLVPHRGQQLAYDDPGRRGGCHPLRRSPSCTARDDLVEGEPAVEVLLGGVADLGVDDAVGGQVLDALARHPGEVRRPVCITATVWSKVSR